MVDTKHSGFGKYPLDKAALGLLMLGSKHGYSLYQDFKQAFGLIWKAGQTKFYVVLSDLEQEGCLQATTSPQAGRPARKIYHLTDSGQQAFMAWLKAPVRSMRAVRVELIAKLRFFNLLELPGALDLLDEQQQVFQEMQDEWTREVSSDPFLDLVQDFRIRQAAAIIDWLDACKGLTEKGIFK